MYLLFILKIIYNTNMAFTWEETKDLENIFKIKPGPEFGPGY